MSLFRIEVFSNRYPTTFDIDATNEGMAMYKAWKEWRKRFKGQRVKAHCIRIAQ